jgi:hypothetical protein
MSTQKQIDATPDALMVHLVECANANNSLMDGTTAPVKRIIAAHKIVFAIWQDGDAPHGVDCLLIKGSDKLRRIAAGKTPVEVSITAIAVCDTEQAVAAARVLGDKAARVEHAPSAAIEGDEHGLYVAVDGVRIARRGEPGTPQAKTWVSMEPGYEVFDDLGRTSLCINYTPPTVH